MGLEIMEIEQQSEKGLTSAPVSIRPKPRKLLPANTDMLAIDCIPLASI